jgi:hypothetical protein
MREQESAPAAHMLVELRENTGNKEGDADSLTGITTFTQAFAKSKHPQQVSPAVAA